MKLFRSILTRPFAAAIAVLATATLLAACDIDSVDSTTSVVSDNDGTIYDYSGLYMSVSNSSDNTNGYAGLVYPEGKQSGVTLTWLRLLQYGSVLEAYDNAGMNWDGSISSISSGTASFNLQGKTTAGASVEIAGSLRYADQSSTMDATWIESGFAGSIFARATVSPATTNTPVGEVTLESDRYTVSSNETAYLTASGGSTYTWPSSVSYGTFSSSGSTAEYTRTGGTSSNSVSITVYSGSDYDSVTIEFD